MPTTSRAPPPPRPAQGSKAPRLPHGLSAESTPNSRGPAVNLGAKRKVLGRHFHKRFRTAERGCHIRTGLSCFTSTSLPEATRNQDCLPAEMRAAAAGGPGPGPGPELRPRRSNEHSLRHPRAGKSSYCSIPQFFKNNQK